MPSMMPSWHPSLETQEELHVLKDPLAYQHQRSNWLLKPSSWWPCRTCRWIRDFVAAFFRLLLTEYWIDQVYTLLLIVGFLLGCWAAIEGVLHSVKGAAAQDSSCDAAYITIPGPIVTVSLVGQTPKGPNHGTYYYLVINGTTRWLDSVEPPTTAVSLPTGSPLTTGTASPQAYFVDGILMSKQCPYCLRFQALRARRTRQVRVSCSAQARGEAWP